ncbi:MULTISPECIES: hypothetical protein [Collinsella]|uniref:Uncharacterized protein n=1 Tax=Collinsella ihumii TaxID=1720204 RepID=A0AAW7K3H5_9ACTN|nr:MULTISPECIES: hypothetical protein [Collinsella]MDN0069411.1 hypothetical protein [Collinsella ihumii]
MLEGNKDISNLEDDQPASLKQDEGPNKDGPAKSDSEKGFSGLYYDVIKHAEPNVNTVKVEQQKIVINVNDSYEDLDDGKIGDAKAQQDRDTSSNDFNETPLNIISKALQKDIDRNYDRIRGLESDYDRTISEIYNIKSDIHHLRDSEAANQNSFDEKYGKILQDLEKFGKQQEESTDSLSSTINSLNGAAKALISIISTMYAIRKLVFTILIASVLLTVISIYINNTVENNISLFVSAVIDVIVAVISLVHFHEWRLQKARQLARDWGITIDESDLI